MTNQLLSIRIYVDLIFCLDSQIQSAFETVEEDEIIHGGTKRGENE